MDKETLLSQLNAFGIEMALVSFPLSSGQSDEPSVFYKGKGKGVFRTNKIVETSPDTFEKINKALIAKVAPFMVKESYKTTDGFDQAPTQTIYIVDIATGKEVTLDTSLHSSELDTLRFSLPEMYSLANSLSDLSYDPATSISEITVSYSGRGDLSDKIQVAIDGSDEVSDKERSRIENVVRGLLAMNHHDWESDAGGAGEIKIDLASGQYTIHHEAYDEERKTIKHELELNQWNEVKEQVEKLRALGDEAEINYYIHDGRTLVYLVSVDNESLHNDTPDIDLSVLREVFEKEIHRHNKTVSEQIKKGEYSELFNNNTSFEDYLEGKVTVGLNDGSIEIEQFYWIPKVQRTETRRYVRLPELREQYIEAQTQRDDKQAVSGPRPSYK